MLKSVDVAIMSVLSILVVADIVGNSLVCFIILKNQDMRIPMNYLLVNLAVADIMFATFIIPQHILTKAFTHPVGVSGTVLCRVLTGGNLAWVGAASSAVTLVFIATERYFSVTSPVSNKGKLTKQKLKMIIPGSWIFALIVNISLFFVTNFDKNTARCERMWPEKWMAHAQNWGWLVLLVLLPLAVMTGFYSRVVCTLWLKRNDGNKLSYRQQEVMRVRKRVTLTVITVSIIFGVCWLTDAVIYCLSDFGLVLAGSTTYAISNTVVMFNSAVNPFVYALMSQQFRTKIKKMMCFTRPSTRVAHSERERNNIELASNL
ncbi:hypothetical protein ACROYT_G041127 [Oculina patagonica]